jgi:acyl-CoA dehydrogenase
VGPVIPKNIRTSFKVGKLSGRKTAVIDGADADFAVVLARSSDEPGERGLALALVDLKAPGVTRRPQDSIDPSRKHAEIAFDGAAAEALGKPGEGWTLASRALDRAAILFAFEQIGGADTCLAMAKDYAITRYAFGRPIGSYQAIKHKLADMYVNTELARSNAYYGAWALLTDARELPLAAAAARVSATQAFDYAAKESTQTHGGIGYTWEMDCHLYYKRSRELGLVVGSQRSWKDRLVAELETSNAA